MIQEYYTYVVGRNTFIEKISSDPPKKYLQLYPQIFTNLRKRGNRDIPLSTLDATNVNTRIIIEILLGEIPFLAERLDTGRNLPE